MAPDEFGETVTTTTMGGSLTTDQLLQAGISGGLGNVELRISWGWVTYGLWDVARWVLSMDGSRSRSGAGSELGALGKSGSCPTTTRRAVWLVVKHHCIISSMKQKSSQSGKCAVLNARVNEAETVSAKASSANSSNASSAAHTNSPQACPISPHHSGPP